MFRVPGTLNTKARDLGRKDPYVRIVEGHEHLAALEEIIEGRKDRDNIYSRPTDKLLNDFYLYLMHKKVESRVEDFARTERRLLKSLSSVGIVGRDISDNSEVIPWIDKLLRTAVADNRKNLLFWVLGPYLTTIKKFDYDKAYKILERWLEQCDSLNRLEPDWRTFEYRVDYCLRRSEEKERKPIRLQTFMELYPELYKSLLNEKNSSNNSSNEIETDGGGE
jgi:hypothetical protein